MGISPQMVYYFSISQCPVTPYAVCLHSILDLLCMLTANDDPIHLPLQYSLIIN